MSLRLQINNVLVCLVMLPGWLGGCARANPATRDHVDIGKSKSVDTLFHIPGNDQKSDKFALETTCGEAEMIVRAAIEGMLYESGFCVQDSDCNSIESGHMCLIVSEMPVSSKELYNWKFAIDALIDFFCRQCPGSVTLDAPLSERLRCVSYQCVFDIRDREGVPSELKGEDARSARPPSND